MMLVRKPYAKLARPLASRVMDRRGSSMSAAIRALFASNEQGIWLDASDFSTMYQDSAGTTPVTAVGQPVGLMLDKSRGLVRGAELTPSPYVGSVSGAWAIGAGSITRNGSTTGQATLNLSGGLLDTNKRYAVSFNVSGISGDAFGVRLGGGTAYGPLSANGVYTYHIPAGTTVASFVVIPWAGSAGEANISNISVREIPGAHATQSTAASRPVLQQENGLYFLSFDGVDDFLVTPSIDFTSTDKMTVIAGVRKLSDAGAGIITELGASTATVAGSFALYSSGLISDASRRTYGSNLNAGVEIGTGAPGYLAPITNVVTAMLDIAGATNAGEQKLRINGASVGLTFSAAGPAGTGNFGNYPLYIGRRGGTSLPFNGRLYSLIVRGAASNDSQITSAERYVANKTGVSL